MKNTQSIASIIAIALVAGCGSGTGTPVAPVPAKSAAVPQSNGKKVATTVAFKVGPKRSGASRAVRSKNKRDYVSPDTMGATIVATSTTGTDANDVSIGYDLSTANTTSCVADSNPADGGRTCTLSLPLNPDTYAITVSTYNAVETTGTPNAGDVELSTQTQTPVTISSSTTNALSFLLQPFVEGFTVVGETVSGGAQSSDYLTFPGALGGTASTPSSVTFSALDPDGNIIDQYAGGTSFANGPFNVSVNDGDGAADTTGCGTGAQSCVTVSAGGGTSYSDGSASSTPAQIVGDAAMTDETVSFTYSGGGGPGTAIENDPSESTNPSTIMVNGAPGTRAYYAHVSVNGGSAENGKNPVGISAYVVPLFAYPTSATVTPNGTQVVWAAQSSPPNGALYPSPGSYTALFGQSGGTSGSSASCVDPNSNGTIFTVDSGTEYQFYGAAYTVTAGSTAGTCTLFLSDGGTPSDVATVTLTNGTGNATIGIPGAGATKTPSKKTR